MTKELMEQIRVRIMSEAYDLADRNDSEGYNAIKVMCSDVLAMIEEPEQDFDAIAERQLLSLKRATRKTTEDATVRAVHKMADELQPEQEQLKAEEHSVLRQAIWDTAEVVAPPQRKPLTFEEILAIAEESRKHVYPSIAFARAIEAAHGIKP